LLIAAIVNEDDATSKYVTQSSETSGWKATDQSPAVTLTFTSSCLADQYQDMSKTGEYVTPVTVNVIADDL
jgi:hypothetical protein